ncbi:MAG: amidohydrolase [Dehalococcoidia bacterium]|nr:amidohydrolase [Dehalococcoidia bacterium]
MTQSRQSRSQQVRSRLSHPVIDSDGHYLEITSVYLDFLREVGGHEMAERYIKPNPVNLHYHSPLMATSPADRRDAWTKRPSFWGFPAENTRDRATAFFPSVLAERLDEFGIDFTILYPTEGVLIPSFEDAEFRQASCRAFNTYLAALYGPYADRMTPVAIIPMWTPEEAIAELTHAVQVLGLKSVMLSSATGCVFRRVPQRDRDFPNASHLLTRPDYFGMDSEHDYDPFWAKCVELKIAPTFHCGQVAWGSRQSISNFMFNHIGVLAAGEEPLAKALFLGGVTRRFPTLNFGFLEGGIGWGASLYAGILSHWQRRNVNEIQHLNPARIDVDAIIAQARKEPNARIASHVDDIRAAQEKVKLQQRQWNIDDFAACDIRRPEDIRDLFVPRFYFGCEADDPQNPIAFDTKINPFNSKLRAILGSDIGHWDVPHMNDVIHEAWEQVEDGRITEPDFRDFVFTNSARLYAGANPDFFKGTRVESAVSTLIDSGELQG